MQDRYSASRSHEGPGGRIVPLEGVLTDDAVDADYDEVARQIRDGFPDTIAVQDRRQQRLWPLYKTYARCRGSCDQGDSPCPTPEACHNWRDDEDADSQFGCLEGIVESRWIMAACWAVILGVSAGGALLIALLLRHIP